MRKSYFIFGHKVERYKYQLLDCAASLHGSVNGTTDMLGAEEALLLHGFLSKRLADWGDSIPEFAAYDNAVHTVCKIAMEEYERSHMAVDLADVGRSTTK